MNTYLIISSLLNFSASLLLVTVVSLGRKSNAAWQTFFYFLLALTGWSGAYYLWQISTDSRWANIFCQTLTVCSVFIPITLFHFSLSLSGIKKQKTLTAGYCIALGISALVPFGLIMDGVSAKLGHEHWPNSGVLMPLYLTFFTVYESLSGWVLILGKNLHVGRRATDHLFVIYTLLIGFFGGATNFPLWYDIPLQPYGNILVSVYVLLMGYGILNRRISGISTDIYKFLTSLILSFSAALFYILAITLYRSLTKNPMTGIELVYHSSAAFIISILAFWLVPILRFQAERIIDSVFRENESDALKELQSLPTQLSDLAEEERIISLTGDTIIRNTNANSIAILTAEPFANYFNCRYQEGLFTSESDSLRLPLESPLTQQLSASPECIVYDQVYGEINNPYYTYLVSLKQQFNISLIVPIFANHNVYGLILLGELSSRTMWSDEETAALFNIGSQVGLGMRARDFERRSGEVDKLVALGTMAAGLAHEIRNPLVSVQTLASLLKKERSLDSLPDSFKSVLLRDVQRIQSIVDGVALYSKNQTIKTAPVKLNEILHQALNITDADCKRVSLTIEKDLNSLSDTLVLADFNQLMQVFQNLIENAIQAMEKTPNPKLFMKAVIKSNQQSGTRNWVEVSVEDNGPGIPQGLIDRVFDPFVTSKDTGTRDTQSGMGLGLAISKRIIESHSGAITVENIKGGGARFLISLKVLELSE